MPLIDHYEAIARESARMLGAARLGDWAGLVDAERDCAVHIDMVRALSAMGLTDAERERKNAIIRQVLQDDANIRMLTEPWMAQLQDLLRGSALERKVSRMYG